MSQATTSKKDNMYAIDLFETKNVDEGAYSQLTPGSSALATANAATLAKAFKESLPEVELDFGNQPLRLNSKEINFLANYYDQLGSKELQTKFIYDVMPRFNRVYELLVKRGLRQPLVVAPDSQPELPGLQEKKSNDTPKYKDVGVQRAVRQAQADFPTAASDDEAFIKSMMVQQDQDQKNIDRLKTGLDRQRDLLNKNAQLDQTQDQTIDSLDKEINTVEKDNDDLQLSLQQMQRANAELQQKLATMRGKKTDSPEIQPVAAEPVRPEPVVGVSVATDKDPSGYKYRQARLTAAQRAMSQRLKQIDTARLKDPSQGAGLGQMASQIARSSAVAQNDERQADLFAAEDLTHGLEEAEVIPTKQVMQGYIVEYNPQSKVVTISQRGQVLKQYKISTPSRRAYDQTVNKFIRNQEDDKYPDDIEDRDVRLPMRAREIEESKSEVWTIHFTDGTAVRYRASDETDPAAVRKNYANKGKTVAKFDYGFGVDQPAGPGPEAHEPGSGRAVSARTGETLPEDTMGEFKAAALAKIKKALANPKLDPATRKDYETRLHKLQALEEGNVIPVDFRQGASSEDLVAFKNTRGDYFDKIARASQAGDVESVKRLRVELKDLEDAARRRGLIK